MKLKNKNIKNDSSVYMLKLVQTFNIKETLNVKHLANIMEFYDGDKFIGIINYMFYQVLDFKKLYIRNIYFVNEKYLDSMIKIFVSKMKNIYNSIFTNVKHNNFDNKTIETLLNNNFQGDEYISFKY